MSELRGIEIHNKENFQILNPFSLYARIKEPIV